MRFFASAGGLTNCGHGTIAAQAVLLHRSGATEHHGRQRTAGRTFATTAIRRRDGVEVWFDQGVIALADHIDATGSGIIAALGLQRADIAAGVRVASPGTPRLLVPVRDHPTLLSMQPGDGELLRAYCFVGERGEVPVFLGDPTADEVELGIGIRGTEPGWEHWSEEEWTAWHATTPSESDVMAMAGRWSIDPTTIDDAAVTSTGIYGLPPSVSGE